MGRKIILSSILALIISIFLFSNIYALDSPGTSSVNQPYSFCQVCADASYITLSSIQTPNETTILNINMTSNGTGQYCYTFTPLQQGRYDFRGISDGCDKTFSTYLDVTFDGSSQSIGQAMLYSIISLLLLGIIIYCFFMIKNNPEKSMKILFFNIAYILLIPFTFLLKQIASIYIYSQIWLVNILSTLNLILIIGLPILIIGGGVYLLYHYFMNKKINQLTSMGYSPDEARQFSGK